MTAPRPLLAPPNQMANAIRALSMDAVEAAKSGHPGMPMGMADVATVLFGQFLKHDPANPAWPDRDRFVLSAGHGSMLLYSLLYLTGYPDIGIAEIKRFRQLGSPTAGHPEHGHAAGVETTTGPLGQGIATAVGMALAERLLAARFGGDLVDHHIYVIASDGDLMEGVSHEAAGLAGHLRLGKLIVLFDDNGITIDGATSLAVSENVPARFEAAGWETVRVDGHDHQAIAAAIEAAQASDQPTLIACKTTIGFGAPNKAGKASSHGAPLGPDEIAGARQALGWTNPAFEVPNELMDAWRAAGRNAAAERDAWTERLAAAPAETHSAFEDAVAGRYDTAALATALAAHRSALSTEKPKLATRASSQKALEVINPVVATTVGGSADLSGSNNTKTSDLGVISADDFSGRYVHYGVREHGMAAAMNGMALHGGVIPYSGTFLVFSDYCRPAIRLAALMEQRVIHVMTHDSIGLGEDGPTHQPVEHLAALRAIPNLHVFRPCDAVEVAEVWEVALALANRPSVIALSRQGLPTLREDGGSENKAARGGYVLREARGPAQVTLIATGSEVEIAAAAHEILEADGVATRVVSLPCWSLFDQQPADYRAKVLGEGTVRIAVEAAIGQGWERYVGDAGGFVGMSGFGASAPAGDLYKHFGITAETVVAAAKARLG